MTLAKYYAQNRPEYDNMIGDAFKYYHTTFDDYEHFLVDTYEPLFKLIRDFVERY